MIRLSRALHPLLRRYGIKGTAIIVVSSIVLLCIGGGAVLAQLGGTLLQSQSSSVQLQKGLMAWWKFDGNANDSTPYRNSGTVSNATLTTDRKSKANSAYAFNGTSAVITVPNSNSLSVTGNLTLSAWVKVTNDGNYQPIIAKGATSEYELAADFRAGATNLRLVTSGGTETATGFFTNFTGSWVHIAVVTNGTNDIFYRNGSPVATTNYSTASSSSTAVTIGNRGAFFFNGSLDGLRVYNRALNATEIKALYDQYDGGISAASGEKGLIGWWRLDGNTNDSTPYRNNGTITGTGATLTADRKGAANSAYHFDGTASYISLGTASRFNLTGDFTISAWIRPGTSVQGNTARIFGKKSGTVTNYALVYGAAGTSVRLAVDAGTSVGLTSTTAVTDTTKWYLVTGVRSGNTLYLYINGTQEDTGAISGANQTNTTALGINGVAGTRFNGDIDDARLYNRALSATEIAAQYASYNSQINLNSNSTSGSTNIYKGLTGEWDFTGNTNDSTPYRHTATISGATLTTDRKGASSSAYSFNGSNQSLWLPAAAMPTSQMSLSFWAKQTSLVNWTSLISNSWYTQDYSWVAYTSANGSVYYGIEHLGNEYDGICGAGTFTVNTWHHIVGTYDGTTVRLYVDGNQCATTATITSAALYHGDFVRVGGVGTSAAQTIDDVRLYNRPLSLAEVQVLFAR